MRVENDYLNKNQNVDKSPASHENVNVSKSDIIGAFSLDISGTVRADNAYGNQGKTTADIMQTAEQSNTVLQRDYMIVMSNSMSSEDFAELEKDGFNPNNTEVETLVTVADKIKAELIQAGIQVDGYTDDISIDKLEEITGSKPMAKEIATKLAENDVPVTEENVESVKQAVDKTEELSSLSEGVLKYMVKAEKEPTIDNLYKAQFSAATDSNKQGKGYYADETGYYAKKAEDYHWEQLMPQIEKVIADAGKEVTEATKEDAKWLIEKGIPLTSESVNLLLKLKEVSVGQSRNAMIELITRAMGEGKTAGETSLAVSEPIYKKAADILAEVEQISEEAVDVTAKQGGVFTIKDLLAVQRQILSGYTFDDSKNINNENINSMETKPPAEDKSARTPAATAKRQLEEIRLHMSYEVNIKLLKSGFRIDTTELEQVVEALKSVEKEQNFILFDGQDDQDTEIKASLFKEVVGKTADIASMPAAVLGRAIAEGTSFTLNYIHREGTILQGAYKAAGETYEALITMPRRDLGDSIKKAFRNVDNLLNEIDLAPTESNRRAVRILGYNNMPVNAGNVAAIQDADESLNRVLQKMTPAAAIKMIRDNVDPLTMSMPELEQYLSGMGENILQETEKYSKYLYKLEKNHAITESEREEYIGIYRLFRQIEKSDGAVIGSLVNQGAELSLKNLLSAVRTQKQKGMNVTIDNETGIHKANYHENLVKDILDNISPDKLKGMDISAGTELEALAKQLQADSGEAGDALTKQYRQTQLDNMRNIKDVEDYIVKLLTDFDQPVTIDNLLAADYLSNTRGSTYKELLEKAKELDKNKKTADTTKLTEVLEEAINRLQTDFTGKEAALEAYKNLHAVAEEILDTTASAEKPKSIDLKSMALTFKQVSLATNLAQEENYEIPVKIGAEMTSINLRILHGSEDTGKVTATMRTKDYGEVAAELSIEDGKISGFVASDHQEGVEELRQIETSFAEALLKNGKTIKNLDFIYSKDLNIHNFSKEAEKTINHHKVSSKELYNTAKDFIYSLQNYHNNR